jgi:hypothetical protein
MTFMKTYHEYFLGIGSKEATPPTLQERITNKIIENFKKLYINGHPFIQRSGFLILMKGEHDASVRQRRDFTLS